ncbi:glycosyl transferase family protein [Albirhodobacter sp. R86504]|uniref:glycosyl transferase family protein n=1 Tax=Albirhodobacter sp. R86504 TaxID=3093848 RepID=UPI00366B2A0F
MTEPAPFTPAQSLAPYVQQLGRGPSKSRHLTRDEAQDAMTIVLEQRAAPEAVGALLMLWRYRSENPDEIAGIVLAMRARLGVWRKIAPDLDWPSYAAGKSRGLPWFLLAAKLTASAGHKIVLHGLNSHQANAAAVRPALPIVGIAQASTPDAVKAALDLTNIAYIPLEAMDQRFVELLALREHLGLRSPVNTALRALNPCAARAQVQGVFHPPYRALQQDGARALGEQHLRVLKGGGGEFERQPNKAVELMGLDHGAPFDTVAPALLQGAKRMSEAADGATDPSALAALWAGDLTDEFALMIVLGTAALALGVLEGLDHTDAFRRATDLWSVRPR